MRYYVLHSVINTKCCKAIAKKSFDVYAKQFQVALKLKIASINLERCDMIRI